MSPRSQSPEPAADALNQALHLNPLGHTGGDRLVRAIQQLDDGLIERTYLEVKTSLEPGRRGAAAIAKFILGSANRLLADITEHFDGHAVMVIGSAHAPKDTLQYRDQHEIIRDVNRYLSHPGPTWDSNVIEVDSARYLIVAVAPPQPGDPVHTSPKDGDGIANGQVYIRKSSETRPATSAEHAALVDRAKQPAATATVVIHSHTAIAPANLGTAMLERIVSTVRTDMEKRLPNTKRDQAHDRLGLANMSAINRLAESNPLRLLQPDVPTIEKIDSRERFIRSKWPEFEDRWIGAFWPATRFEITNTGETFLKDVEIIVHITGMVRAVDKRDSRRSADQLFDELLGTRNPWSLPDLLTVPTPHPQQEVFSRTTPDGINVHIRLQKLRGEQTILSLGALVVIAESAGLDTRTANWTLTAESHDRVYRGHLELAVADLPDLSLIDTSIRERKAADLPV